MDKNSGRTTGDGKNVEKGDKGVRTWGEKGKERRTTSRRPHLALQHGHETPPLSRSADATFSPRNFQHRIEPSLIFTFIHTGIILRDPLHLIRTYLRRIRLPSQFSIYSSLTSSLSPHPLSPFSFPSVLSSFFPSFLPFSLSHLSSSRSLLPSMIPCCSEKKTLLWTHPSYIVECGKETGIVSARGGGMGERVAFRRAAGDVSCRLLVAA